MKSITKKAIAEKFNIRESLVVTQEEYENYKGNKSELYILGDFISDIKEYHGEKPMFKYCSGNVRFNSLSSATTQVAGDIGGYAWFNKLKFARAQVIGNVKGNVFFDNLEFAEAQVAGDIGGDADFPNLQSAETRVVSNVGGSAYFNGV